MAIKLSTIRSCATLKICSLATLLLLLGADASNGQMLKGRVTDEKDHAINHAHIQLLRDGKQRYRCYSRKNGTYQVWPVDPGYYQALITVEGYDRMVRDINLKRTDSSVIDFSLHKKPGLLAR